MGDKPLAGDHAPSSVAFLLSQVGIHASQRFARRIAEIDLQPPQFRVLNMVDAVEGRSQQAIAEAIGAPSEPDGRDRRRARGAAADRAPPPSR